MTPLIRYHQVSAAALSLFLLAVPHSASSAAASAQFQMTIDGGHAFLKNGSQLVAGTVKYPDSTTATTCISKRATPQRSRA